MGRFMLQLKMWQKGGLMGVIGVLMVTIPCALLFSAQWDRLSGAQREARGVAPANELLQVIQLFQQHRGLSAAVLSGNQSMQTQRQDRQTQVDAHLKSFLGSLANDHDSQQTAQQLSQTWQALSHDVASGGVTSPQSFQRHTALIAQSMSLLQTLADRAGLSFDPDPTISRLVASVLHDLPRLTESLGQARARGSAVLTKGTATSTDRADLAALGQMARLHLENARFGIEQAGQGDGQIRATLAPTLAAAIEQAGKGFALIDERLVRAEELDLPAPDYFAQMTHVIDAEYQLIDRSFLLLRDQLQAREQSAVSHFGMLAGSIALLALICGWMMAVVVRQTTQNIGQALAVARTVAAGDLRSHVRVDGSDELCQLLNELGHMNAGLVDLVARLRLGADSIANGSAEIAAGNQDLSGRTETQASSLEETAASMEELASTVKLSAENARQASELARAASDAASAGGQAMTQVVTMMAEIANSSRKMADIIGVIDGIAFQTNILALNAAVEAARAGEQGRGFAVVAGEVRNLAQRSAQAAREIKDMIHDSMNQVELGSSLVTDTGSNMSDMVVRVKRVADLVGEISASAAEQSSGIAQVNEAVTQMDQLTQQNAALVEQVAAASSSLSEQANRLGQAVAVFQV